MAPDVTANSSDNDAGLVIFRASRLEALVSPLREMLRQTCPDSVLAPQTVVAAHPGMKQWLTGALAREAGPGGIVANLEVILPSTWLDRVAGERLGAQAVKLPAWQRAHLRWTVHDLLRPGHAVPGVTDTRIERYLAPAAGTGNAEAAHASSAADAARRRFQLADRLAGLYSQYLIYRSDWLRAWERGKLDEATARTADTDARRLESELLAPLWRALKARLGAHRADAVDALVTALEHDAAREPLHVFGLSHLAPRELEVLRAWARRAPVCLYVPDPCREYWGGLVRPGHVDELRAWTAQEQARIDNAGVGDWCETQGHPLLARWGRLGQHFFASLVEGEVREDMRHWQDEGDDAPTHRLQRLQAGIRRLQPSLLDESVPEEPQARKAWQQHGRSDASLRLHACHTRLRELEVLRDALLDAVEHEGVRAGGIVVMAPDITAYAPLIPAVFGEPGSPRERVLPYHLSDVPIARAHRLFSTFTRLLDLGSSRATTPEIADLLAVPEVALRLGLGGDARDGLLGWLERSRVAWALDGTHRAAFAAPAIADHTFAWAMDRLLAGYVMADAPDDARTAALDLPDGTRLLPLAGVQGPATSSLGALDRLLCELQRWRDLAGRTLPASAWAEELQQRIDALLRADADDGDAVEALKTIGRIIAQLAAEPAKADLDPPLHFAVVRELLLDALGSVPERQRFLMGGITFCGMVPQRAIPFDMVCVLGLNDGEFPRSHRDGGLDLMARVRRLGDRDVRSDDRYLFLETVMSARKRLHLSWIGQDVRDGSARNPAPPLAELITALDHAAGTQQLSLERAHPDRPWWVWHPLQPFDDRYFDGTDAALYSYSQPFARQDGGGHRAPRAFVDGAAGAPDPLPMPLSLPAFARFFKRPADDLLARRLQLDLEALDGEHLPASEPLDERLDRLETIARRVFFAEALPTGFADDGSVRWDAASLPDWVAHAGLLPPGELGRIAWRNEANAVLALLAAAAAQGVDGGAARAGGSVEVDLALAMANGDTARVHGVVEHVFPDPASGGQVLLRAFPKAGPDAKKALKSVDDLDYGDLVRIFIEWAALRLHTAAQPAPPPIRLAMLAMKGEGWDGFGWQAWDQRFIAQPLARAGMLDGLRSRLAVLLGLWQHAAAEPPVYLPGVAWKARRAWRKALDGASAAGAEPDAAVALTAGVHGTAVAHTDTSPDAQATATQAAWVAAAKVAHEAMDGGGWGGQGGGVRTHAPGYNRLLARGTEFRLDDDGAPTPELQRLLAYAGQLHDLIRLDTPTTPPGRIDD
ncbi:exodeoxyribonuclease V subunit gamma [Aerolutibacter ruishenii]|uniref:RecBCD enzyme subunit RecC n=1 Tax=Aerolutibacter ruishenii TaxID=686800 RepID=A0A562LRW4_9GAMM|nr:exodeoxyribonuclease V subunit gamma [Lysobacter ruishenii]TWI10303.1 DNA helicase/exodeoxyribonuclease V gamma subunit [Lysobacter ruishenii]